MRRGSIRNGRITEVKRRAKNTKEIAPDLKAMIQAMTVRQKGEAKRNLPPTHTITKNTNNCI